MNIVENGYKQRNEKASLIIIIFNKSKEWAGNKEMNIYTAFKRFYIVQFKKEN